MKRGQTIVAERERAESESERMQARRKQKRKSRASVIVVLLFLAFLGLLAYTGARGVVERSQKLPEGESEEYIITAEIVDETGRGTSGASGTSGSAGSSGASGAGISARMRQYIARVERNFRDLGYKVKKVTLPVNTSREIYVDLEGETMYFKMNIDRDAAVSAEDAIRMLKYIKAQGAAAKYVDVRVEGKGYYK